MKLLSVNGSNVGLLKGPFEFTFGDTLTTITGPIGCGKSTLLTMIKSSLTNTIPGSGSSWVSWGMDDKEPSYFTVTWELNDRILKITRPLADNTIFKALDIPRISLTTFEGEVIEEAFTPREAAEILLNMLPVSPKVIDSHLIIDQDRITYPVSATPAKFQETIHVLTKVNEMELIRSKLRESLGAYTIPEVADEVDNLQVELDTIQGHLDDYTAQKADASTKLERIDEKVLLNEIAQLKEAESNEYKISQVNQELESFKSQKVSMEARLANMQEAKSKIDESWEESVAFSEKSKEFLATYAYKVREWNEVQETKEELTNLNQSISSLNTPAPPEGGEPNEEILNELQANADSTRVQLIGLKKKSELAALGCCPECGHKTDDIDTAKLQTEITHHDDIVKQTDKLLAQVKSKRKEFAEYRGELEQVTSAKSGLEDGISRCHTRLAKLSDSGPISEEDKLSWDAAIQNHEELVQANNTLTRNIEDSRGRLEVYESGIVNNNRTLELLGGAAPPNPTRLTVLTEQQEYVLGLRKQLDTLSGSEQARTDELTRTQEKLDILKKRAALAEPIKRYRDVLERAIDILHKNNLPKFVSSRYLVEINTKLDMYLNMVEASFSAWIDDDLQFMVKKTDGLIHRANRLSGGQKQQASVAYLLAVSDVFASSLGVLALDEPTGSMQEENAKDVAEAFSGLVSISKQTKRQFIVITHSETLASYGEVQLNLKGYM